MNNKVVGASGEQDAKEYLIDNGYDIIALNEIVAGVEIDIICRIDDIIVFCEVKNRETESYGRGIESINKTKIQRYVRAGKVYMTKKDRQNCSLRFDVIEINHGKLEHVEDAFRG